MAVMVLVVSCPSRTEVSHLLGRRSSSIVLRNVRLFGLILATRCVLNVTDGRDLRLRLTPVGGSRRSYRLWSMRIGRIRIHGTC